MVVRIRDMLATPGELVLWRAQFAFNVVFFFTLNSLLASAPWACHSTLFAA